MKKKLEHNAVTLTCKFKDQNGNLIRESRTILYFDLFKEAQSYIEFIKGDHCKIVEREFNIGIPRGAYSCDCSIAQHKLVKIAEKLAGSRDDGLRWSIVKEYEETLFYTKERVI